MEFKLRLNILGVRWQWEKIGPAEVADRSRSRFQPGRTRPRVEKQKTNATRPKIPAPERVPEGADPCTVVLARSASESSPKTPRAARTDERGITSALSMLPVHSRTRRLIEQRQAAFKCLPSSEETSSINARGTNVLLTHFFGK